MDEFNKTPLNRREYITANDPRDIIDLYGKKTLIDGKKENTQKGVVEYHAIVVANETRGLPKKAGWIQSMLNFFVGKDSPPGEELLEMSTFIGYIVGPQPINQGDRLPHDNIPPPCGVLLGSVDTLDRDTKSSLVMLQNVGTFLVAGMEPPMIGSKVRVSFSQMPSAGVMRGGMYLGPLTTKTAVIGIDEKIQRKCVGTGAGSSLSGFAFGGAVTPVRITNAERKQNIKKAMEILTTDDKCKIFSGRNLTEEQAAGVIGNLLAESSMNGASINVGDAPKCGLGQDLYKNSFGLAQWNCERAKRLADFAGISPTNNDEMRAIDFDTQVKYICHELVRKEKGAANRLEKATTAAEAAEAMFWYERFAGYPGDTNPDHKAHGLKTQASRRGYAVEALRIGKDHLSFIPSESDAKIEPPVSVAPVSTAGYYYSPGSRIREAIAGETSTTPSKANVQHSPSPYLAGE